MVRPSLIHRAGREQQRRTPTIAVALHEIEPATYERCALIRDWLDDHGVDRVTMLVIPARDLHPLGERSPAMVDWLLERRGMGDSIAQHGFRHQRLGRRGAVRRLGPAARQLRAPRGAEFAGLDDSEGKARGRSWAAPAQARGDRA